MWLLYPQENCHAYSHTQQNVKSSSVSECGCNEEGSINGKCDTITGQCFCKKYQWNGQRCHIPISNCSSDQITCKSGQCVGQKSWLCDSCQACDDSSDEDEQFCGQIEENKECQKCSLLGTEYCDTVNGKCVCKDGYFGSTCKRKITWYTLECSAI